MKEKNPYQHLSSVCEVKVRFNEVDSLGIIWHGHYLRFLEDGREHFGKEFGLGYLDFYESGFIVPIVDLNIEYKLPVTYGDSLIIHTHYIDQAAAKLVFEYDIYRASDEMLVATAKTIQVFLTLDKQLYITIPPIMEDWKRKNLVKQS